MRGAASVAMRRCMGAGNDSQKGGVAVDGRGYEYWVCGWGWGWGDAQVLQGIVSCMNVHLCQHGTCEVQRYERYGCAHRLWHVAQPCGCWVR